MVQDLKVGNTDSICVVTYSMLHTFMTSCLRKLVRVCPAVISLTAFSHRIVKHTTIVTDNVSQLFAFRSHSSYLLSFIDLFA